MAAPSTKKKTRQKKRASSTTKKPLHQRRVTRRAKQFPEGTFDNQLMVPTMRFICLRCGESQHVVWSDVRRKYVQEHGGLPCERCGDDDPADRSGED